MDLCPNCGTSNPDSTITCQNCQADLSQQKTMENIPKAPKSKVPIIALVSVIAVIALVAMLIFMFSGNNPESTANNWIDEFNAGNIEDSFQYTDAYFLSQNEQDLIVDSFESNNEDIAFSIERFLRQASQK